MKKAAFTNLVFTILLPFLINCSGAAEFTVKFGADLQSQLTPAPSPTPTNPPGSVDSSLLEFLGKEWRATSIINRSACKAPNVCDPVVIPMQYTHTLKIEGKQSPFQLSGNGSCNDYSGSVAVGSVSDSQIEYKLSLYAMTMIACADLNANREEDLYLSSLAQTAVLSWGNAAKNMIKLSSADQTVEVLFTLSAPPPVSSVNLEAVIGKTFKAEDYLEDVCPKPAASGPSCYAISLTKYAFLHTLSFKKVGARYFVTGNAGCNQYEGELVPVSVLKNVVRYSLRPIVITEMACATPEAQAEEIAYINGLSGTTYIEFSDTGLKATDNQNSVVIRFSKM